LIFGSSFLAIGYAGYCYWAISQMKMTPEQVKVQILTAKEKEEIQAMNATIPPETQQDALEMMLKISGLIRSGANEFLTKEYTYLTVFCGIFSVLIYIATDAQEMPNNSEIQYMPFTTIAFFIGAATSMLCGYIGMAVAVYTNVRTTYACNISINDGFHVAFKGGKVLGFALVGLAILVLQLLILAYRKLVLPDNFGQYEVQVSELSRQLFEIIAGYGLGGSTVALFGRVGGGIYTKAADVGADLAGKVCEGLEEDSPDNPGTIADNVGDNVGDIAGMGADLFGSLAESTCAALVISAHSLSILGTTDATYFPLMVSAIGIIASYVSVLFVRVGEVTSENVENKLKLQLTLSTSIMTAFLYAIIFVMPEVTLIEFAGVKYEPTRWHIFACVVSGLWSGLAIGFITEYYTSNKYGPVQTLVESTRMGAAPNIILGLALGYMSTIAPILLIAITIWVSFTFAGMYGVALAAIGMLGCLPVALAIDGYGPIADNAGGISEMSGLDESVRHLTDKLDAAGNTTAAIGKGFAIGSACLVSLALFGAYIVRVEEASEGTHSYTVNVLQPTTFAGLIVGAMIPYAFSAMTMAAVGEAANEMITEIKAQFILMKQGQPPNHERCVAISTKASLKKMIAPGALVIFTPVTVGLLFSKNALNGLLAGIIVSGIQIAFSASNTGGAWDNAKKSIETGEYTSKIPLNDDEQATPFIFRKKDKDGNPTEEHKAAVVGDTVGDPLKDTSGPAINILIKLSAITSLIFGGFIAQ